MKERFDIQFFAEGDGSNGGNGGQIASADALPNLASLNAQMNAEHSRGTPRVDQNVQSNVKNTSQNVAAVSNTPGTVDNTGGMFDMIMGGSPEGQGTNQPNDTTATPAEGANAASGYQDFQIPEGLQYDRTLHDKFAAMASKLGLSQEQAQELVSGYASDLLRREDALLSVIKNRNQELLMELKDDPVLGRQNLPATATKVKAVIDRFGDRSIVEYMMEGHANDRRLIGFLARISDYFVERPAVSGAVSPINSERVSTPESVSKLMFPGMEG